jgi:hypothetical protein
MEVAPIRGEASHAAPANAKVIDPHFSSRQQRDR